VHADAVVKQRSQFAAGAEIDGMPAAEVGHSSRQPALSNWALRRDDLPDITPRPADIAFSPTSRQWRVAATWDHPTLAPPERSRESHGHDTADVRGRKGWELVTIAIDVRYDSLPTDQRDRPGDLGHRHTGNYDNPSRVTSTYET
jgi:hypothetical protein